ncbi:hypothetical protein BEWA_033600 [Theileria equi strain WA]|uniref:Peptidyl-prolyl cis-trans isomerase n=1 Tax=Theileria equi strain WA TaxID=1537102 RepID=L0AY67_THEEQ|nr:hypothetical protein BEWA_033600 [Theileria equi strain WA]AFZ80505.1 hypothetical protein BEWA_033600 [Theileria equi strain WA]|eukprot:XP_004830171.1 hypothetical protein BEWA_033600 [Theileria equi strain WA]
MSSSEKIRCAHILLKHTESRNPVNRRTNQKVFRTKDEANREIADILVRLKEAVNLGHEFKRIATDISECSSAKNGGDLGYFDRFTMQKPFTEAAFRLKVDEISDIVDTDSGIHIIYRIA